MEYTFGYSFKTWDDDKSFADAPSILRYLNQASEEFNVKDKIVYHQKVISYNFDTKDNLWTLKVINPTTQEESYYSSQFIFNASGYYNYDHGYTPEFKGLENFKGTFIHPQKWNTNLNYKDKKVVVTGGSGFIGTHFIEELLDRGALVKTHTHESPLKIKDSRIEVLENIKSQIKKERIDIKALNNKKAKEILKKLGYNKYYEHIPFIKDKLGIKPPVMTPELEDSLCNLFMEIQGPYAKFCPDDRVNF